MNSFNIELDPFPGNRCSPSKSSHFPRELHVSSEPFSHANHLHSTLPEGNVNEATEGHCKGACYRHPHTPGLGRFNKHKNVHNVVELQNESDLSIFPHSNFPRVFFVTRRRNGGKSRSSIHFLGVEFFLRSSLKDQ